MATEVEILAELAEQLIRQADDFRPGFLNPSVRNLPEKLQSGRLTLAVLGQFKRGKSTLINALLDAKLLPSSVLPLTSVLTVALYADQPGLVVHFEDGRQEAHPVAALADFVTEEKNPKNEKAVAWAEVRWPSAFLRRPVQVVDTPGVGSVYSHNTQTSEAFLSRLDAAVFVLGVDPILTQTEIDWLLKVKDQAERFFFVLNKVDQLSPQETDQVVNFARERLHELWGDSSRVYALSAKKALADSAAPAFAAFRQDLLTFLDQEGERTLLQSSRRKLARGARELLAIISLERTAAGRPVAELRQWLESLKGYEEKLTLERARAYWVMDEAQTKVLVELKRHFDERWEASRDETRRDVEAAWQSASTVGKGRQAMAEALQKRLAALFDAFQARVEETCRRHFDQAASYLLREYQALMDAMVQNAGDRFQIHLPRVELEAPEQKRSRFYLKIVTEMAELPLPGSGILDLLPRAWGDYIAKRVFIKRMEQFYEMNRSRLLTDAADRFQARSGEVVLTFIASTQQLLGRIRESIERGLALQERTEAEREAVVSDLIGREENLRILLERCGANEGSAG